MKGMLGYAPITTPVMLKAVKFWAAARKMGRQSADDVSLDADMILSAQAGMTDPSDQIPESRVHRIVNAARQRHAPLWVKRCLHGSHYLATADP